MKDTPAHKFGPLVDPPWRGKLEAIGVHDFGPANPVRKCSFTDDDVIAVQRWLDRKGAHCGGRAHIQKGFYAGMDDDDLAVISPDFGPGDEIIWCVEFCGRMIPRNFFSSWDAYEFAKCLAPGESIRREGVPADCPDEDVPGIHREIEQPFVPLEEMYLSPGDMGRLSGISSRGGRSRFGLVDALVRALSAALDDPVPEKDTTDARGKLLNPESHSDEPMVINMACSSSLHNMLGRHPEMRAFRGAEPRHFAAALSVIEQKRGWVNVGLDVTCHGLLSSWYRRTGSPDLWVPAKEVEEVAQSSDEKKLNDLLL